MDRVAVGAWNGGGFGPAVAAGLFSMTIFGFYGALLPFGVFGIVGGAGVGLLWTLGIGWAADRLMRRPRWRAWLANGPIFVSIVGIGLLAGAGFMYIFMMQEAVHEPSTTYAVLSALMQPAVPYYIAINSLLELLVMICVVYFNWDAGRERRLYSLLGVGLYLAMRVWTYLVYAEMRLEISTHTLSAADVAWFTRTLAADYRPMLVVVSQAFFVLAALAPVRTPRARKTPG